MLMIPITKQADCSICLSPFDSPKQSEYLLTENKVYTACKHVFHEKCFKDWMKEKPSCPNCRSEIKEYTILEYKNIFYSSKEGSYLPLLLLIPIIYICVVSHKEEVKKVQEIVKRIEHQPLNVLISFREKLLTYPQTSLRYSLLRELDRIIKNKTGNP